MPGTAVMVELVAADCEAGPKACTTSVVVRTFRSAVKIVKPSSTAPAQVRFIESLSGIVVVMRKIAPGIAWCLVFAACSSQESAPAADTVPGPTPTVQRTPIGELPDIDGDAVLAHTKALASDQFEGRGPGTKGEELTVNYLVEQFKKIGLKPGNPDGGYVQNVPLVIRSGVGAEHWLKWADDVVAWSKHVADSAAIDNSEMVFVGYGVVAPEFDWDDYKGIDVKGKTLVMLINDPPVPDPSNGSQLDPKTFGGRAMTYYGRWTYKYEIGVEKGAAGVLIIHETEPAGYPFEVLQGGNLGEKLDLITPDKNMGRAAIEGWITVDQGREILKMGGQDFDALKKQAATREF